MHDGGDFLATRIKEASLEKVLGFFKGQHSKIRVVLLVLVEKSKHLE
jgi:hypothetical protein